MKVLVFTTSYPNRMYPRLGNFVQERMSEVGKLCSLQVLAPVSIASILKASKNNKVIKIPKYEVLNGLTVYHPRFFVVPRFFKFMDGLFLFLSSLNTARQISRTFDFDLIDAHFAYPDGFAGVLLGKYFKKPVTITLRGTINRLIKIPGRRQAIKFALSKAEKIFSVSSYLVSLARSLDIDEEKFVVIPNGVNPNLFKSLNKDWCRKELGIPKSTKVLISVGALVERKGHHRVIEVIPKILQEYSHFRFLIVGGGGVEGNIEAALKQEVKKLGLSNIVTFTGEVDQRMVNKLLCASDVFVLATRYEGWANVFFEAMACGLPVVTTDVCGNSEVIKDDRYGVLVPFGDKDKLAQSIIDAFQRDWDRDEIMRYASSRTWSHVAREVYEQFREILGKE